MKTKNCDGNLYSDDADIQAPDEHSGVGLGEQQD